MDYYDSACSLFRHRFGLLIVGMRFHAIACFLIALVNPVSPLAAADDLSNAVVHVTVRSRSPLPLRPWRLAEPESSEGSGVIIPGNRILTAAHVVLDGVRIEVRRSDRARRYTATVEHLAYPCDLAVLTVDDSSFFEGSRTLQVGDLAPPGTTVRVAGFPVGGDSLAFTEGIVSRYGLGPLSLSREEILLAQVDAPINSGSSGGPVLVGNQIVGLAVASLDGAENVGYVVPAPVITHFLAGIEDGRFDGFPRLGVWWQPVANQGHRDFLGLQDAKQGGLLVTQLLPDGTGVDVLMPGDVILGIDDVPIRADGNVVLMPGVQIDPDYLIARKQPGDPVSLDLLRGGARVEISTVARTLRWIIPSRTRRYVVFGGLVMQPLSVAYGVRFEDDLPYNLLGYFEREVTLHPSRRELIVISAILEHPVNRGYEHHEDEVIERVNQSAIAGLEELLQAIDNSSTDWIEFTTDMGSRIVMSRTQAQASFQVLSTEYDIPIDRGLEK